MNGVIGVMGSAAGNLTDELKGKARKIGAEIAQNGYILATGACPGLPLEAAFGAAENGGTVIGFSPAKDKKEHSTVFNFPTEPFTALIYTGFGFKGRNVISIRTCDAVIFISGRMGTLNEFTLAFDESKVIGVLRGTGGFADEFGRIIQISAENGKEPKNLICFESDPVELVKRILLKIGLIRGL